MTDEILRAIWGLAACYPAMSLTQRWRLKALPQTIAVTLWTIPVWWAYAHVKTLVIGWLG